jgi:c-di-GMP-related signal transduction protein
MEAGSMEIFISRQAIFDKYLRVIGYELLHRSTEENHFNRISDDGVMETNEVLVNTFLVFGLKNLTRGKRAFINFPINSLLKESPALLPVNSLVIEVLEEYLPNQDVYQSLARLKKNGYLLALDDFRICPEHCSLIHLMDIVKVCFRENSSAQRRAIARLLKSKKVKMLAEKVETYEEFEEAKELGFTYFQGYFFSKPMVLQSKDIKTFNPNFADLLREVYQQEIDYEKVEKLIKKDVALPYKLLRYINSLSFGLLNEVHSIRHAVTYLGQNGLKKWISLMSLRSIIHSKPSELFVQALSRGIFCESLAPELAMTNRSGDLFLTGLFSHLDAFLDQPMARIIEDLPVSVDVRKTLIGEHNSLRDILDMVILYEQGQWREFAVLAKKLDLTEEIVLSKYHHCLQETDLIFESI